MKKFNEKEYFSGKDVSKKVGRGYRTIIIWYEAKQYAEENNIDFPEGLPEVYRDFDARGTRYWDKQGIEQLIKFKKKLKLGDLSFYNRKIWGKRGVKIQENADNAKIKKEQMDGEKRIEAKEKE